MSGKAAEYGKTFMQQVLAKIGNEERRKIVEETFLDPANQDALVTIGSGALAQSDINKQYTELQALRTDLESKTSQVQADYERLTGWYTERQADLEELERLRKGGTGDPPKPGATPSSVDLSKYISREDFEKVMRQEQFAAANYVGLLNGISLKHLQDFHEVIDTRELLADANLGKAKQDGSVYGLLDAYETKYKDKLTAHREQQKQAEIQKLVDAQVAERMKGMPNLPIPLKNGLASPLDLLDAGTEVKPEQYSAQAAAEEYMRLQQVRSAG